MMVHRGLVRLAGSRALRGPVLACAGVGGALFAAHVALAALVGRLVGDILAGGRLGDSWGIVAAALVVLAVRAGLLWGREVVAQAASAAIKVRLRDRVYRHVVALGPAWVASQRSGAVQSTAVDGIEGLDAYYSRYLPQLLVCVTGPPAVLVWVALTDPWVGGLVGVAILAMLGAPRLLDAALRRRGRDHWRAFSGLAADHLDAVQGITTLKAFDAAAHQRARLLERGAHLLRTTMRQMAVSLADSAVTEAGLQVGTAVAVAVGAWQVTRGALSVEALAVLLMMVSVLFRPYRELAAAWHAGFVGISAADGITDVLSAAPAVADGARELAPDDDGSIELRGVWFTYPGRPAPALRDVSLRVAPGERLGLVGPSGAGKSTVVALLLRFVAPDTGAILVGGRPVEELTAASVRRRIAVVSQHTYLFAGSVADNLRLARPTATDGELVAACRAAGIHDEVMEHPAGYDRPVGERGQVLSGGQRQRLAIARALLADAAALVFDEATSAVDAATEEQVLAAVERASAGRTTITIAHRLGTVRHCDRIVVLDDGAVAEAGSHDELVARGGVYAGLHAAGARA